MDPWLQEETLDELDRIAAHGAVRQRRVGEAVVRDFVATLNAQRFYVFLTILPDFASAMLNVRNIGFCVMVEPTV